MDKQKKFVKTLKLTVNDRLTWEALGRLRNTNKMAQYVCAALHNYVRSPEGQNQLDLYAPDP